MISAGNTCAEGATDDVQALSNAMRQMLETEIDGQQLSDSVRQIASPEVIGKRLSDLFVELLVASRHA